MFLTQQTSVQRLRAALHNNYVPEEIIGFLQTHIVADVFDLLSMLSKNSYSIWDHMYFIIENLPVIFWMNPELFNLKYVIK